MAAAGITSTQEPLGPGSREHAPPTHAAREAILRRNNVVVRGSGPPILFVHGFGCDQGMWRFVAPHFEATNTVVLMDIVGMGRSDTRAWSPQRYASLDGYATDVLEVIDAVGLGPVHLVGHSVAAMMGVLAAAREPQSVASLVLVGPSPRYIDDDGYRGGFAPADIEGLLDTLDSNYLGWSSAMAPVIMGNPDRPELGAELAASFCRTDPAIARHFARVTFLSDNRDDLGRADVPALVLQCSDDPIAPDTVGAYVAQRMPHASLVRLKATGHCPNLSHPEETRQAIQAFLRRSLRADHAARPAR